jgi:hypothetical protein
LRDTDARSNLGAELERTGWIDIDQFLDAVFRESVARYFRPQDPVRAITQLIISAHEAGFDPTLLPLLETEALIRKSLGEDVEVSDIDEELAASIKTNVFVVVADVAGWTSPGKLDEVLRIAEDAVFEAGGTPTMA